MTTRPSDAPWADGPFALIMTPGKRQDISDTSHFYIRAATGMTRAHNAILGGLNAILLQAPNVPSAGDARYKPRDVADLVKFVGYWVKMTNHHHSLEETYMFPEMAKFGGHPALLEGPLHQHSLFQEGLDRLRAYAAATQPHEYRWSGGMEDVVDSSSGHLATHLYDEIDVFLSFGHLGSDGYDAAWAGTDAAASQSGNFGQKIGMLYGIFPCVYGCSDRTYEGSHLFPKLHWTLPYFIKYWFALGNGAWRFSPSDWWCRPKPLGFGPQSE